jgi:hypothetical protein
VVAPPTLFVVTYFTGGKLEHGQMSHWYIRIETLSVKDILMALGTMFLILVRVAVMEGCVILRRVYIFLTKSIGSPGEKTERRQQRNACISALKHCVFLT